MIEEEGRGRGVVAGSVAMVELLAWWWFCSKGLLIFCTLGPP